MPSVFPRKVVVADFAPLALPILFPRDRLRPLPLLRPRPLPPLPELFPPPCVVEPVSVMFSDSFIAKNDILWCSLHFTPRRRSYCDPSSGDFLYYTAICLEGIRDPYQHLVPNDEFSCCFSARVVSLLSLSPVGFPVCRSCSLAGVVRALSASCRIEAIQNVRLL